MIHIIRNNYLLLHEKMLSIPGVGHITNTQLFPGYKIYVACPHKVHKLWLQKRLIVIINNKSYNVNIIFQQLLLTTTDQERVL